MKDGGLNKAALCWQIKLQYFYVWQRTPDKMYHYTSINITTDTNCVFQCFLLPPPQRTQFNFQLSSGLSFQSPVSLLLIDSSFSLLSFLWVSSLQFSVFLFWMEVGFNGCCCPLPQLQTPITLCFAFLGIPHTTSIRNKNMRQKHCSAAGNARSSFWDKMMFH